MQYLALIYNTEGNDDVDWETLIGQYRVFGEEAGAAGVLVGGNALEPVSTATSLQVRNGKTALVDGPFAETKEQLGGYYMLECKDLDEALQWAAGPFGNSLHERKNPVTHRTPTSLLGKSLPQCACTLPDNISPVEPIVIVDYGAGNLRSGS